MFCPNCGKPIQEDDNFCRYCGKNLKEKDTSNVVVEKQSEEEFLYDGEELVLYEVEKHWMSIFWPIFLTPLFLIYFWTIFLNTHSIFSWFVVIAILIVIIYPLVRYKSDQIVITTNFAHIKLGVINPVEIEIPLDKLNILNVSQTSMGRVLDYGTISFCNKSEKYEYSYVKFPEDIQYIIDNPVQFLKESLENA